MYRVVCPRGEGSGCLPYADKVYIVRDRFYVACVTVQ